MIHKTTTVLGLLLKVCGYCHRYLLLLQRHQSIIILSIWKFFGSCLCNGTPLPSQGVFDLFIICSLFHLYFFLLSQFSLLFLSYHCFTYIFITLSFLSWFFFHVSAFSWLFVISLCRSFHIFCSVLFFVLFKEVTHCPQFMHWLIPWVRAPMLPSKFCPQPLPKSTTCQPVVCYKRWGGGVAHADVAAIASYQRFNSFRWNYAVYWNFTITRDWHKYSRM